MRTFQRLAVSVAVAGLSLGAAAGAASASASTGRARDQIAAAPVQRVTSGTTTITTAPGLVSGLLAASIAATAITPASEVGATANGQLVEYFSTPVLPSVISLAHLSGWLNHTGGIFFLRPGVPVREISYSDFIVNIKNRLLSAMVDGNPQKRIGLLEVDLTNATYTQSKTTVRATGIVLRVTPAAASEFNAALGIPLLTPGQDFGTATTVLKYH
jgi:hypothetical protein